MATIIITIILNVLLGTPTETTKDQDQNATTTSTTSTTSTTPSTTETMNAMGGSGTWVNIEK
ncbi:hypothetical protein [Pontibacter indicus]|uniref:Uncharacterized protein n=1 Tax=Pontibacter indicus TaxID=1317125 RepID=A0A1R3WWX1_9BACT|nr:hypothetical protein [Pontibacter indicus]SIT82579.1 hypothetical protein SAMN05444128_1141 [Pontibacter indicus]